MLVETFLHTIVGHKQNKFLWSVLKPLGWEIITHYKGRKPLGSIPCQNVMSNEQNTEDCFF